MLSYRLHIYKLAMTVSGDATQLAMLMSPYKNWSSYPGDVKREMLERDTPDMMRQVDSLVSSVEQFRDALPAEFNFRRASHLMRHLSWIRRRVNENAPYLCISDPIDIASRDIFDTLDSFETWYKNRSLEDVDLANRLRPFIVQGELNAAAREAWAIFKTRMVNRFDIPDNLDGHRLADRLFSSDGVAASLLTENECSGYLNLFKGLYTLNRNPVAHNDIPVDPEFIEATLALVNVAIVRIESASSVGQNSQYVN